MTDHTIPLAALGRLNIHARAYAAYGQRNAIYSYKTLAALILAIDREASLRFVKWTGKCNRCTDGQFTHWSWDDGYSVRCRDCGGSGLQTLRFTETTLPDGQVWHHPWNGYTSPGLDIAHAALGVSMRDNGEYMTADGTIIEWQDPGEWRPMLPAQALPLEELVALLNEVEDWIEAAPCRPRGQAFWWAWDAAKRHLHQRKHRGVIGEPSHGYKLDLGRVPGGCFVCGDKRDLEGYCFGRLTPLFHWSLPVCKAHSKSPHPNDQPPTQLITPSIRRWLDRHECIEETN